MSSLAIQKVVQVPAGMIAGATDATTGFLEGVFHAGSLRRENELLRRQAIAADLYVQREAALRTQIESLRKLLGFSPAPGANKVPATVTGYFPFENRMTLDAGTAHGIRVGLPVVTGDGLLGVIQTVGSSSSQALLITSPALKIGGMVLKSPPEFGLLRGYSANVASLDFLDARSGIRVGDWVVTSGFSENVPRGIPIGRIIEITEDPQFGSLRAKVFPHVRIGLAREVFILR